MNARLAHITVMLMPTAPTPKDHSIVPVIQDTLEMESLVMVNSSHSSEEFMFEYRKFPLID